MEQQRSEQDSSVGDALALALRCASFCSVSLSLFASYSLVPLLMRPRHFALSCAICSHDAVCMLKSLTEALKVVPVLVLRFVALWFMLQGDLFNACHFVFVFFSPFSIASLWEESANLSAFRTFVRFVLVWIYQFSLSLGVWEGLRFVIVALNGLFSYLFCIAFSNHHGSVRPFLVLHRGFSLANVPHASW